MMSVAARRAQVDGHLVIAEQAEAGKRPAGKILETHLSGDRGQFLGADAAGVSSANHRTNTGASQKIDGDMLFFKNFEHADMGQAAGKSSAQSQPDLGRARRLGRGFRPHRARYLASKSPD
jgi:hypothetical protein